MLSTTKWLGRIPWLLIPVLLLSCTIAQAQNITATLSGIATDQTDARVPGAKILVKNEATGDLRDSKSDTQGFWSVTALIPGTYTVTISAKGFSPWEENGILLNQGDSRTVANIHLKIGAADAAVTVISGADAEVPVDTAEISATLNNELVDSAVLTGRDAAELIKMMPGVTFNNGGSAGSGFNSMTTGTNNGPAGNFSANGTQPYGSTALMLDGAMLVDPGNAGTQIANINQDMTDSVKFMSASYGAEYAKGPAVLQAFSKSGGQKFHGEGYLYARNSALGFANDWNNKAQEEAAAAGAVGATPASILASNTISPSDYYYIGGNVGGPISFLGFNKNKDKLFFWAGYEKMIQHPYVAPVDMNVPTSGVFGESSQLGGDFNNTGIDSHVTTGPYANAYNLPCATDNGWQGCNAAIAPWVGYGAKGASGIAPNIKQYFDPIGSLVTGLVPTENVKPNSSNGWSNYAISPVQPADRWEVTGKVNYSLNDNNKIWGSYTTQIETDNHPISIWWAPSGTIPYPGDPVGKETAHVYLANYTHVFSASTTNEFVFAYAEFINDISLTKPNAVSRKALGFPAGSVFGASHEVDSIPDFTGGWEDGLAYIGDTGQNQYDGGLYGANSFGKTAKAPNVSDTFTRIVGTHSIKAGMYWDTQYNVQSSGADINGTFTAVTYGAISTNNETLDRLMGRNQAYTEQSTVPNLAPQWHQWSLWAQDSWKFNRKLTLNLGLRADHMGQWYVPSGSQVWDPANYNNSANAPANTGIEWHSIDSSVPLSGWASKLFTYNPRVGFAYDVFGTGKTVVRSGFGIYQYQVSANDGSAAMAGPVGSFGFNTTQSGGPTGFNGYNINNGLLSVLNSTRNGFVNQQLTVPTGTSENGGSPSLEKLGDNQVPYADTWSFGVAQALPGHTVAEVSYVGSASRNQLENGANGHINDANAINYGAFFNEPDLVTGQFTNIAPCGPIYNAEAVLQPGGCPNNPAGNLPSTGSPIIVPPATTGTFAEAGVSAPSAGDWHPLRNYGDIYILTHGGFANYNSLQVSAQKQSGNLYLFTNFTFGKVLGTRDGSTSNGNGNGPVVDPFSLDANYGPLEYDHTKTFNVSFSYKLPKPIHNNWLAGEIVNGWQLSGYTTYEDGAPLQTASGPNLNANFQPLGNAPGNTSVQNQVFNIPNATQAWVGGNQTQTINTSTWFGSNQYENGLQEVLTCDPRKGLKSGQYFNPNCFAAPMGPTSTTFGQMGQIIWPYIRTPHYVGSDLAIFKAFRVTDAQRVEVRISATNWLNHANGVFGQNGNSDQGLNFYGVSSGSNLVFNSNSSTTGTPASKTGYRWMQFAAKYYF